MFKSLIGFFTASLLATSVCAQPVAPTVEPVTAAPSVAAPDMMQQMNKLMASKNAQASMGQVIVVGMLVGCTQKTAGKQATQAFYDEMQGVGKVVESDCKLGHPDQARTLMLDTLNTKQNDPVVKSMLTCYDSQQAAISGMGGPKIAADAEHYARWIKNPELAKSEMTESDICKNKKI